MFLSNHWWGYIISYSIFSLLNSFRLIKLCSFHSPWMDMHSWPCVILSPNILNWLYSEINFDVLNEWMTVPCPSPWAYAQPNKGNIYTESYNVPENNVPCLRVQSHYWPEWDSNMIPLGHRGNVKPRWIDDHT